MELFELKKEVTCMKKLSFLSLLLCGSSVFAMNNHMPEADEQDYTMARSIAQSLRPVSAQEAAIQEETLHAIHAESERYQLAVNQSEQRQLEAFTKKEIERQKNAAQVLALSFSQLPKNERFTIAEKQQFQQRIGNLPQSLQKEIGEFVAKPMTNFINQHLKELIPCVVPRNKKDLAMNEMVRVAEMKLTDFYAANSNLAQANAVLVAADPNAVLADIALPIAQNRYIMAMCGYWSFEDQASKFRFRRMNATENQTKDSDFWLAQRYQNPAAIVGQDQIVIVNLMGQNEFRAILYSDGSIEWKIDPLHTAHLKMFSREQLELGVKLYQQAKDLSSREIETLRSLSSDMRKALKSNYDIPLSKAEAVRIKASQHSITALKYAGVAAWLGGVAYFTSRHVSYPLKYPDIKDSRMVADVYLDSRGVTSERCSPEIRHLMREFYAQDIHRCHFAIYFPSFFLRHLGIKVAQLYLPALVLVAGVEIDQWESQGRDRYRPRDNDAFWRKALICTGGAMLAGFTYAACRGIKGYLSSWATTQPGS